MANFFTLLWSSTHFAFTYNCLHSKCHICSCALPKRLFFFLTCFVLYQRVWVSEDYWYGCNYISNTQENIWRNIKCVWSDCKGKMTHEQVHHLWIKQPRNRKLRMVALFDFFGTVNNFTNMQECRNLGRGLAEFQADLLQVMTPRSLWTRCPCLYFTVESSTIFPAHRRGQVHLQSGIKMNSTPSPSPSIQTILTPNRTHKIRSYELAASYTSS